MSESELKEVETLVNEQIFNAVDVVTRVMAVDEAKKLGAMALFGEKYGEFVRVVMVNEFSKEFCGGTHIENTSKIGLFRIISEGSVASGVRRIEAATGAGVLRMLDEYNTVISSSMKTLKTTNMNDLPAVCEHTAAELKEKDKEIERLTAKLSAMSIDTMISQAASVNGIRIIKGKFPAANAAMLKTMSDRVLEIASDAVAVMFGIDGDKASLAVACGKDAQAKGAHAGKIVRQIAELTGGKGGGKPERAMAGVGDCSKINAALSESESVILSFVQ